MKLPPFLEQEPVFPLFHRVRVKPPPAAGLDVPRAVEQQVLAALDRMRWKPGQRVAVAVGSRGIAGIRTIVASTCRVLKAVGLRPFIIPAMGSHGGATADGQAAVLSALGVTGDACGAEVCSSLDVRRIGIVRDEVPVYFARDALEADHSICINRVKPHTKFKAPVESGLLKMLCVGMGKHAGAIAYHRWAVRIGFHPLLLEMGGLLLAKTNFRFGLAIVEDALDRTLHIEAVDAPHVREREPVLLEMSKSNFPRLPVKELDVLVIEQIGKEISGAGMDPNVTGRAFDLGESDFSEVLNARRVAILGLSEASGGNGLGMGNADIITERLFRSLDYGRTLMNGLTSLSLRKAFIPVRMPDDRKAIQASIATLGPVDPEHVRMVVIRDTLHVVDFLASSTLAGELRNRGDCLIGAPQPLLFDSEGRLRIGW
ncbi:MAG: hypothetical protein ACOWWM_04445 [Desulfobacterales bacterium]